MDEIELVVKIPKEEYEMIVNSEDCGLHTLTRAIANGTPLPKGHSELVYREDVCNELRYMDNNGCITRSVNHVIEDIKKGVKTIIEADKEEE